VGSNDFFGPKNGLTSSNEQKWMIFIFNLPSARSATSSCEFFRPLLQTENNSSSLQVLFLLFQSAE
jgi:hypothetical protein